MPSEDLLTPYRHAKRAQQRVCKSVQQLTNLKAESARRRGIIKLMLYMLISIKT